MQQQIKQTTEYYLSNLPDDKEFYYLEDFEDSGFPTFLSRRIRLALSQKILQSVSVPQTEWANVQDDAVVESWHQFINSFETAARVPVNKIEQLLKQAVTDIIYILVQPKQTIPGLLFDEKNTMSAEQLDERIKWLVVYPHFGQVLTRYLKRKGKDELSCRQCDNIIARVDEKITQNYTPFQWEEMLRPLFELVNSPIEADLFRLFFEDRQMDQLSKKFAEIDSGLTRNEFTDILIKGQEQESDDLGENKEETDEIKTSPPEVQHKHTDDNPPSLQDEEDSKEQDAIPIEIGFSEESIFAPDEPTNKHTDSEETGLNQGFIGGSINQDAKTEDDKETISENQNVQDMSSVGDETEQEKNPFSLNDIFSDNSEPDNDVPIPDNEISQNQINIFTEQQGGNDQVPIWQRFADTEDTHKNKQPAGNLEGAELRGEQDVLRKHLQNREDYFIGTLFGGSGPNYLDMLENISNQGSWKEAYQLVDHEIFKPNKINIYSEEAVEFIDRLQNYFLEVKS